MRALGLERGRMPPLKDAIAWAWTAAYLVVFAQIELGHKIPLGIVLLFVPLFLLPLAPFKRIPLTRAQGIALGVTTILPLAVAWSLLIDLSWLTAAVVPAMVVVAMLCSRFPATAITLVIACTTAYGSMREYLSWPAQKSIDVLLGGLWLAAMWRWIIFPRPKGDRVLIWPALACVIGYVLFTAGEILTAETSNIGLQSFRQSIWYLAVALLVAYAPWHEITRRRIERILMFSIILVGGYATLRWAIGPSAKEKALASVVKYNFHGDKLRPIGSMITVKELAAWSAMTVPFAAGMALWLRGRWRLLAIAAGLISATVMFAVDVRAAPAGAIPGVFVALLLYATAQSFRGRRGATVGVAMLATLVVGGGAFALTVGGEQDSGKRYEAIINPANDVSYQGRLIKWRSAWDDISRAPLGHGLGTSGTVQFRFGRTQNINSLSVDNSYIKVAYEQGFVVMTIFVATLLFLLLGLARRALVTTDPARAGPAIAACGTLVSMLIIFFIGDYVEGVPVITGWLIVGLGLRQFTWEHRAPAPPEPEPLPGNAW
jgi:O-antigen ligase/polysaccharide polymerase Wzy-like membrane protein